LRAYCLSLLLLLLLRLLLRLLRLRMIVYTFRQLS
jgi:hypothetical protein